MLLLILLFHFWSSSVSIRKNLFVHKNIPTVQTDAKNPILVSSCVQLLWTPLALVLQMLWQPSSSWYVLKKQMLLICKASLNFSRGADTFGAVSNKMGIFKFCLSVFYQDFFGFLHHLLWAHPAMPTSCSFLHLSLSLTAFQEEHNHASPLLLETAWNSALFAGLQMSWSLKLLWSGSKNYCCVMCTSPGWTEPKFLIPLVFPACAAFLVTLWTVSPAGTGSQCWHFNGIFVQLWHPLLLVERVNLWPDLTASPYLWKWSNPKQEWKGKKNSQGNKLFGFCTQWEHFGLHLDFAFWEVLFVFFARETKFSQNSQGEQNVLLFFSFKEDKGGNRKKIPIFSSSNKNTSQKKKIFNTVFGKSVRIAKV